MVATAMAREGQARGGAGGRRNRCPYPLAGGIPALGIAGANSLSEYHLKLLEGFEVVVWQEPDSGGITFAQKASELFQNVRVIEPPDGIKDASDLWLTMRNRTWRAGEGNFQATGTQNCWRRQSLWSLTQPDELTTTSTYLVICCNLSRSR
jgi:hypothetical protein